MIIGTPHYMAPEQAKGGTVDGRADQYSLAVVGYRMITGELPYTGDSVHTILYKHIFEEMPRISTKRSLVPEFLSLAIARALSKEPGQRFGTMEEFATAVWPSSPSRRRSLASARKHTPPLRRLRRPNATRMHHRGDERSDDTDSARRVEARDGEEETLERRYGGWRAGGRRGRRRRVSRTGQEE